MFFNDDILLACIIVMMFMFVGFGMFFIVFAFMFLINFKNIYSFFEYEKQEQDYQTQFIKYCKNNEFDKMVKLYEKKANELNLISGLNEAGKNENLLICKFIWDQYYYNNILDVLLEKTGFFYEEACLKGRIETCKWLRKMCILTNHQLKIRKNYLFRKLCFNQDLDTLKWFYKNHNINIQNSDEVFLECCINNLVKSVKWLYKIGKKANKPFDVGMNNHYPFRYSCENNFIELAVWLEKKSDIYYLKTSCSTFSDLVFTYLGFEDGEFNRYDLLDYNIVEWKILDKIQVAYDYLLEGNEVEMMKSLGVQKIEKTGEKLQCSICYDYVDKYFEICSYEHPYCYLCLLEWTKKCGLMRCELCKNQFIWSYVSAVSVH